MALALKTFARPLQQQWQQAEVMVFHFQASVVIGQSAVLAANLNIKPMLLEQTCGRKLTRTKKFVKGALKSTLKS